MGIPQKISQKSQRNSKEISSESYTILMKYKRNSIKISSESYTNLIKIPRHTPKKNILLADGNLTKYLIEISVKHLQYFIVIIENRVPTIIQ